MFDRIDRYISRQFILTFAFAIMAFVAIYVAVDLMEHINIFIDRNVSAEIAVKYYVYTLPDILHLVVPIGILLASLFTIGRMDTSHELTAIRAAGRSMRRITLPLFVISAMVSGTMLYFDGWVVPVANKLRYGIDRQYMGGSLAGSYIQGQRNLFLRVSPRVNLLIDYFEPGRAEATLVTIERFDTLAPMVTTGIERASASETIVISDTTTGVRIVERIDAQRMTYDSLHRKWVLHNGVARNLTDPGSMTSEDFVVRDAPPLPITPTELNLSQQKYQELTIDEMQERIGQERMGGRDVDKILVDYYARFSFPFAALIVSFFGIPFSSAQRKSGAAMQVAITALVSALYLVLTEVSKALTYQGDLPPLVTAWLANGLFLVVGIFNLIRVERG